MILLTLIVLLNVTALDIHVLMAIRFSPQRRSSFMNASYFWMMWMLAAYHGLVAAIACYLLVTGVAMPYERVLSDSMHLLLAPFLITSVLSEYRQSPREPNTLARALLWIPAHTRELYFAVLSIAVAAVIARLLEGDNIILSAMRLVGVNELLLVLGSLWMLMELSGLRAGTSSFGGKSKVARAHRIIVFLIIAVFALDFQEDARDEDMVGLVLPFLTLPMVFLLGWRHYRLVFIDVIVRKLVQFVVIVLGSLATLWCVARVPPDTVALVVIQAIIVIAVALHLASKYLDNLWLPGSVTRESFNRDFPAALVSCLTPEAAIAQTEATLAQLFRAEVGVNRSVENQAARVSDKNNPDLYIALGYVRGLYPWFPDALNLVSDAATRLSTHLRLLDLQQKEHLQILRNQQLQDLTAKAELVALRSQIRPHFLFNVLNTIHSFIKTEPDRAEQTLELLADLMRGIIIGGDQDFHNLAREVELAETYLKIEQIRFGERLSFSVEIDDSLQAQPIPVFSVQPLVENAVKYSVEKTLNRAVVELRAFREGDALCVTVNDNGSGLDAKSNDSQGGLGIALRNIEDRLEKHYGSKGKLTLKPGYLGGVEAHLEVPLGISLLDKTAQQLG